MQIRPLIKDLWRTVFIRESNNRSSPISIESLWSDTNLCKGGVEWGCRVIADIKKDIKLGMFCVTCGLKEIIEYLEIVLFIFVLVYFILRIFWYGGQARWRGGCWTKRTFMRDDPCRRLELRPTVDSVEVSQVSETLEEWFGEPT